MGIPSYFSYIVKNHSNIVKKINKLNKKINNLYLDSNSIIYDCFYSMQSDYGNLKQNQFETKLIKSIISKIKDYIKIVKPVGTVMIAFDGVAPSAKLKQQRNRRYKSALEKILKLKRRIFQKKIKHNLLRIK